MFASPVGALRLVRADMNEFESLRAIHRATMYESVVAMLGVWDDGVQLARLRKHWAPEKLLFIERLVDGSWLRIGTICVHLRPQPHMAIDAFVEQFYVLQEHRGAGLGVMCHLLRLADHSQILVRLKVLKNSPALPLYHRLGFCTESSDDNQFHMLRLPGPWLATAA